MKKIAGIFLALFVTILAYSNSYALVEPTKDFYVNDYAGVLSETTKDYIMASSVRLAEETTAQIVVVTVENLEDRPLEEYATDLFRKFGIGDKEKNNGVLILLSVGDRKSRIELGYGMEGYISDAKSGRIQDQYMIPYYKKNDFDSGILNGYKALYNEVSNAYAIKSNIQPQKAEKNNLSTIIILSLPNLVKSLIFSIINSILSI